MAKAGQTGLITGNEAAKTNELQTAAENTKKLTFSTYLTGPHIQESIMKTLGDATKVKTFTSSLISACSTNPDLRKCEASTIISAALLGESLKLSPSPQLGEYYMVPFKDNKHNRTVATFQLGYKGYIQLAIRSGQYRKLNVLPIKEGELIKYDPLEETVEIEMIDNDTEREKTKTIGYYAFFELTNGFKKTLYWSKEKMTAHAKQYSKSFYSSSSFWQKDFDAMACKTMLRQLISKWGIMSIDMQSGYTNDMTVQDKKEDSSEAETIYFDNPVMDLDPETGEVITDAKQAVDAETVEAESNDADPSAAE
jgi:recombination protein RecT